MVSDSAFNRPVDYAERMEALDEHRSFCVSAPAGSGKTELLVQRYLKLLSRVEHPREILSMTFTRKAAAEMQSRIVAALKAAIEDEPTEEHKKLTWNLAKQAMQQSDNLNWRILGNVQQLKIYTIDGLNQRIVADFPITSQLGGTVGVSDSPRQLYVQAIDTLLKRLASQDRDNVTANSDNDLYLSVSRLYDFLDNNSNRVNRLLVSLLETREQWLREMVSVKTGQLNEDAVQDSLDILRASYKQKICYSIGGFQAEFIDALAFCGEVAKQEDKVDTDIQYLYGVESCHSLIDFTDRQWRAVCKILLTSTGGLRKTRRLSEGVPPKNYRDKSLAERAEQIKDYFKQFDAHLRQQVEIVDLLSSFSNLPDKLDNHALVEDLSKLLVALYAELKIVFAENGKADYTEFSLVAQRALEQSLYDGYQSFDDSADSSQNSDEVIQPFWSDRFKHILVDEFQDTSVSQYRLLELLTNGWQAHNEACNGIDKGQYSKTLFIVGDGMQSIYSFRMAKVELFLQAREHGISGIPLSPIQLRQNFRSQPQVIDWVNRHFQAAFPEAIDFARGAVPYTSSVARSQQTVDGVSDQTASTNDVLSVACESSLQEAAWIAEQVKTLKEKGSEQSIAILVQSRPVAAQIINALDRIGVAWAGPDLQPLKDEEVVVDLFALSRAVTNIADDLAWISLLRSPWCGMSLKDIHVFRAISNSRHETLAATILSVGELGSIERLGELEHFTHFVSEVSSSGVRRLYRTARILSIFWHKRYRGSFRVWLEALWRFLAADITAIDGEDKIDKVVHVERVSKCYFDTLESVSADVDSSWFPNLQLLQEKVFRLYSDSDEVQQDIVQIMTIHRSKGLEFDAVFLPSLHKGGRPDDKPLMMLQNRLLEDNDGAQTLLLLGLQPTEPFLASDKKTKRATLFDFLRTERSKAAGYERLRLLYVAATRAKRRLFISGVLQQSDSKDGELSYGSPVKTSLSSGVWKTLKEEFVDCTLDSKQCESLPCSSDENGAVENLVSLKLKRFSDTSIEQLIDQLSSVENLGKAFADGGATQLYPTKTELHSEAGVTDENNWHRQAGIVAHHLLEVYGKACRHFGVDSTEFQRLTDNILHLSMDLDDHSLLAASWVQLLTEQGVHADNIDQAMIRLQSALSAYCQSELLVLQHARDNVFSATELRLYETDHESETQKHVIDAVFVNKHGETWIVDYKIQEPQLGQTVEDFLSQSGIDYQEQLRRYSRSFELFLSHEIKQGSVWTASLPKGELPRVKTALYFPLLDRLHIVDL